MWGVYGCQHNSVETRAFAEGLESLGLPLRLRHHNGFNSRNQTEGFCPVMVSGLRAEGAIIRDAYNALGVPCVVVDYGYLHRVSGVNTFNTGHWHVGIDRLGWVPPFDCPSDRFDALDLVVTDKGQGDKVYICGQHEGDPSHGLDRNGIIKWALDALEDVRGLTDRPIVWRSHPDTNIAISGVENSTGPLDWSDVHSVVTINSNIGHEALLNGVPVVAYGDAPYADLANDCFSEDLFLPPLDVRTSYFNRLAYAQWTLDEIRAGKPQAWLADRGLTKQRKVAA